MQSLRTHLRTASSNLPSPAPPTAPSSPSFNSPSLLVPISSHHHLLHTSSPPTLTVLSLPPLPPTTLPLTPSIPLPPSIRTLLPSSTFTALIAPTSITLAKIATTSSTASLTPLAADIFAARPGLTVVHATWHPRADDYLVVLTSDGSLRLIDALGGGERARLRVVTDGDEAVSFSFGGGGGWPGLACFVLTKGGKVFVASPVAPVGTRVSRGEWEGMRDAAREAAGISGEDSEVIQTGGRRESNVLVEESSGPMIGRITSSVRSWRSRSMATTTTTAMTAAVTSTTRRTLKFNALDDDDDDNDDEDDDGRRMRSSKSGCAASARRPPASPSASTNRFLSVEDDENTAWSVRQAHLQLRFLERAFEQTDAGDMLMMRDFKPLPLLFQGPLHVELDDAPDNDSGSTDSVIFTALTVLDGGLDVPAVLLRCAANGHVSVLVVMEALEGQWFFSENRFGTAGDDVLVANDEYSRAACAVAPAVLCLEHLQFPNPETVALHPVRGKKTDFDVLFARSGSTVYSVRLPFITALRNPEALRESSSALISPLLSAARIGGGPGNDTDTTVIGLAPIFLKNVGPLAVAFTAAHSLEATAPLRWLGGEGGNDFPESLLSVAAAERGDVDFSGSTTRRNMLLQDGKAGADVAEALAAARAARDMQSFKVGAGSVGCVRDAECVTDVLDFVEARVTAFTGGGDGSNNAGAGDHLKSLGVLIPKWADEIVKRCRATNRGVDYAQSEFGRRESESAALAVKLRRVVEFNENLRARVDTLRELHEMRQSALSHAEVARIAKLKERRRNVATARRKIVELTSAVRAQVAAAEAAASARSKRASVGGMQRGTDNAIGSLSVSPLINRRISFSSAYSSGIGSGGRGGGGGGGGGGRGDVGLDSVQLKRIKESLAQHSSSIIMATEKTQAMWEKFASA